MEKTTSGPKGVQAAEMTLRILEIVAQSDTPMGVTQISALAGIAKSAAFKHLHTLSGRGYVIQNTLTSRYGLGPRAWLLSRQAPSLSDLTAVAQPHLEEAREQSGLAVVLSAPTPRELVVLSTLRSRHAIEAGARAGSVLSYHGSAQGKVALAYGNKKVMVRLAVSGLEAITPNTITDMGALEAEIEKIRTNGYASASEEALLGVNAIAAPVFDHEGQFVGSVGIIGLEQHMSRDPQQELIDIIVRLGQKISVALGYNLDRP